VSGYIRHDLLLFSIVENSLKILFFFFFLQQQRVKKPILFFSDFSTDNPLANKPLANIPACADTTRQKTYNTPHRFIRRPP